MTVRLATGADIRQLVACRRDFHFEDEPDAVVDAAFEDECSAFLVHALASDRWAIWVAEIESELVGHVYLELVDKVPRPVRQPQRWGYVTNVYVRPHHRGAGIGSLLLDAAIRWAKEQGVEFLIVWPSEESVGLYARHGFEPASEPMIRELAGDGC